MKDFPVFKVLGVGALTYLVFKKTGVTILEGAPGQGEIVAASDDGSEIAIASPEEPLPAQVDVNGETYANLGDAMLEMDTQGNATLTSDEKAAQMSRTMAGTTHLRLMSGTETIYTAAAPYKRGRNMRRYAIIGKDLPTVRQCSRAGRAVAQWRHKKIRGEMPYRAVPTAHVSLSAAKLATTPCEIFSKVSHGRMSPGAAEKRLRGYYKGHKDMSALERAISRTWK